MNARIAFVLAVTLLIGAGCRQADGPMPTPSGDVPNRLGDISRDLMSVARGDQQAPSDLAEDLRVFVDGPDASTAAPALDELARRVSAVLAGKSLSEQNAQRLAHQLWTAVAAREMSERQVETLQNEMQALLVSVGVAEGSATTAAQQVSDVQAQITQRQRRWYELF